jgi:hypothetical protein
MEKTMEQAIEQAITGPYLTYPQLRRRGWTHAEIIATPPDFIDDELDGADDEPGKFTLRWAMATILRREEEPGWGATHRPAPYLPLYEDTD